LTKTRDVEKKKGRQARKGEHEELKDMGNVEADETKLAANCTVFRGKAEMCEGIIIYLASRESLGAAGWSILNR